MQNTINFNQTRYAHFASQMKTKLIIEALNLHSNCINKVEKKFYAQVKEKKKERKKRKGKEKEKEIHTLSQATNT